MPSIAVNYLLIFALNGQLCMQIRSYYA